MGTKYSLSNYSDEFDVKGVFYCIDIPNVGEVNCRSLLEITRRNYIGPEDAIFIMMNPGSSIPLQGPAKGIHYTLQQFIANKGSNLNNLVQAKPDKVHMYTMELMDREEWSRIKIVNLSDIREASSKDFKMKFKQIMMQINNYNNKTITSIFNGTRAEANIIFNTNAKVICCWGISNPKYITNDAIQFMDNNSINLIGIKGKNKNQYGYLKPIRRSDRVDDLVKII